MKKFLTALSILLIATAAFAETYTIERVIDGDTIVVTTPEGKSQEVDLIGIDAPESGPNDKANKDVWRSGNDIETINKMGQEATEFVKELMAYKGNAVNLEADVGERDKYDRLLAYAYKLVCLHPCKMIERKGYEYESFEDGVYIFVNATIIKSGYATPMTVPPNVKYADLFKELYEEAREQKWGLWQEEIIDGVDDVRIPDEIKF